MTLWSTIKQINAPYMFDRKPGIALHAMQGNNASSLSVGKCHVFFLVVGGT